MAQEDRHGKGQTELLERERTKSPRRFQVLLHNDDYTTMDFVVLVLTQYFHRTSAEATRLMLQVHRKGVAVAGVYSRDVAESKVEQVTRLAEKHGHPLLVTTQPE